MGMPRMSTSRIRDHTFGFDFTNTVELIHESEGRSVLNIANGMLTTLDYVHGQHGDFAVALDYFDNNVFLISLVDAPLGHRILAGIITAQRLWRKRQSGRDLSALSCTCTHAQDLSALMRAC